MDKVYKKIGKRYKEIGHEFTGFPCNGFWVVKDGSSACIQFLDDLPNRPIKMDHKRHINEVCKIIAELQKMPHSAMDISKAICNYFDEIPRESPINF